MTTDKLPDGVSEMVPAYLARRLSSSTSPPADGRPTMYGGTHDLGVPDASSASLHGVYRRISRP